jgi:V8-like Glu-specific endopeptidase
MKIVIISQKSILGKKGIITILLLLFFIKISAQNFECTPNPAKRVRITESNIPNEYSCFMEMKRGWHTYYGSGALIHPRVIITAGHNLAYFPFVKRTPFLLFRGTRKVNLYFGSIDSINYKTNTTVKINKGKNKFFNNWYWISSKINRDFSIIILPDSSIYKKVGGCYNFEVYTGKDKDGNLHITGSPGDKDLFEMWTDSTVNFSIIDSSFRYDLFTAVRNSGSPIWIRSKKGIQLVGVHSRGFGNCNASVLINEKTYRQVVKWCRQAGIDLK